MEKNKNILEMAVEEHNKLKEAAETIAKNKLAEEMADKFNELLKEELKKINKKESLNESKDSDKEEKKETKEVNDDSDKKKETKEVNEDIDLTKTSIEEVENEFNNANAEDDFEIQNDMIDLEELGQELENLENIEAVETPTDNTEVPLETAKDTPEESPEEDTNDPYVRIKKLIDEFNNVLNDMDNMKKNDELTTEFDGKMVEAYGDSYKDTLGEKYEELKEMFIAHQTGKPYGDKKEAVNENKEEEKEVELKEDEIIGAIDNVENETEIEESHGVGLSQQKGVAGDQLPKPDYATYKKDKLRYALQKESFEKKLKNQLEENKKLTKKVNSFKVSDKKSTSLIKEYNEVLKKYRSQLNEMAIFNTNLSHTNNLLVNEELSLTNDDKLNIINKFKVVNNINESEKTYKTLLNDFKTSNNSITEKVEDKLSKNIETSSKNKLDESIKEKTAYSSNEHIDKIKKVFNYIDKNYK